MNENSTHTDLLIQYIDGELQGEQLEAVKRDIENDAHVRDEYEKLKMARAAVQAFGMKTKIRSIHGEMMQEIKTISSSDHESVKRILPMGFRIAATVLFLAGLSALYQYLTATPEKLFIENFQSFNLRETRGEAKNNLENTYKTGNAEALIQQFSQLTNPGAEDYFLCGNAWLGMQDPPKAIAAFLKLQELNKSHITHYFEEDTEYYLAFSYLANEEPGNALPLLEKIHQDPGHPYHKKVSAWFISRLRHTIKP